MRIEHALRLLLLVALLVGAAMTVVAQGLLDDLAIAIANDRADDVSRLLARGMDPDSVDANGDTPLCIAARNGAARSVDALLAAKANPNRANRFNDTPLMLAALNGRMD